MTQENTFTLPRLRLLQALSPQVAAEEEGYKSGDFALDGIGPIGNKVVVMPIQQRGRRENRTQDFDLLCYSGDMEIGVGQPGGNCSTCALNKWTGERGNRTPPQCTEIQAFITFLPEVGDAIFAELEEDEEEAKIIGYDGEIAQWDLARTALPVATNIETQALMRGGMSKLALEVTSKMEVKGARRYYVPVIKRVPIKEDWVKARDETISRMKEAMQAALEQPFEGFQPALMSNLPDSDVEGTTDGQAYDDAIDAAAESL